MTTTITTASMGVLEIGTPKKILGKISRHPLTRTY
jgi:hypothetical protein